MKRAALVCFVVLFVLPAFPAPAERIPNWAAPPTWTPSALERLKGVKGALVTTYAAVPFIPITPCRLVDTRAASGFPLGYGPPSMLGAHAQRDFTVTGVCGIPVGASAVSFNFTVWAPVTRGDIRVFPAGTATPTVATLNWEANIQALANAAVVPLSPAGAITVQVDGPGTIDLIVDVNGFYSMDVSAASDQVLRITTSGGYAIWGVAGLAGVVGQGTKYGVVGAGSTGAGVYGLAGATSPGVLGYSNAAAFGVQGTSDSSSGVAGTSNSGYGVFGSSTSNAGVRGTSTAPGLAGVSGSNNSLASGSHGVAGLASGSGTVFGVRGEIGTDVGIGSAAVHGVGVTGLAGKTYAILGETPDTNLDAAAVMGRTTGGGAAQGIPPTFFASGVRGESFNVGVWGFANTFAVFGRAYTTAGVSAGSGILGYNNGTVTYGAYGAAGGAGATKYGVYSEGNTGASGVKSFVEPHPSKAGTVIRYVALEGPEAGTYFRGRGRFVGHQAVVEVPEDFRLVSDTEGLSIQVTPIGDLAEVAVVSIGLETIELKASRDVEFYYHVNGVRRTFRNWEVISQGDEYMPDGPSAKIPPGFSPGQRRNLIENGTYHEDGTVNMQTAEKLGWTQKWREDERFRPTAVSHAPESPPQVPRQ